MDIRTLVLQRTEVDDVAIVTLKSLLTRNDLVPHPAEYELVITKLPG